MTNVAVLRDGSNPDRLAAETGHLLVPRTPEIFVYDADGNLLRDGRWIYTWDAENRLVRVQSRPDTPQASWRRVEWQYDALGRRIRQTTSVWTNGTWQVTEDLKLISDPVLFGRHIAELNATNNLLVRSYVWGLDLSGTLDGAGGVGGLLWVTMNSGPAAGTHYCCYDGNGNVVGLISATAGTETARYEYGPFAEPIRVSGPASRSNPFRFSTKRADDTTGLVLYEYRAYSFSLGRRPNRDSIGENRGANVYGLVANDPIQFTDMLGLDGGKDERRQRRRSVPVPRPDAGRCAAQCAAKHGADNFGRWFNAAFYCSKLAGLCYHYHTFPPAEELFRVEDLLVHNEPLRKFRSCWLDCVGVADANVNAQLVRAVFRCKHSKQEVEVLLVFSVTVRASGVFAWEEAYQLLGELVCARRAYDTCCGVCKP